MFDRESGYVISDRGRCGLKGKVMLTSSSSFLFYEGLSMILMDISHRQKHRKE